MESIDDRKSGETGGGVIVYEGLKVHLFVPNIFVLKCWWPESNGRGLPNVLCYDFIVSILRCSLCSTSRQSEGIQLGYQKRIDKIY